jgi:prepilin-type N-terminal cleavage/methylation domain-containing protein
MRFQRGFTLIELIAVMVVISIGFVGIAGMFSNMNYGMNSAEAEQKVAQYAQGCADYVLQFRRDNGFSSSSITSSMCSSIISGSDSGYTITMTKYLSGTNTSNSNMCPSGAPNTDCQDWTITAQGGGKTATITLTLMNY